MSVRSTFYFSLLAIYCTVMPATLSGQDRYRNDRLEQRHSDYRSNYNSRSYRGSSRNHHHHSYRNHRHRDYDRYDSRNRGNNRNDCRRDDRRRFRNRGLVDIIIRI